MSLKSNARTKSADPLQEHLREKKSIWNKECSEFIVDLNNFKPKLIAFKRSVNGRGDLKLNLPPSDIKNPLPLELKTFLSGLSSEFRELNNSFAHIVEEAVAIMQEQAQYASKRRKSQKQLRKASVNTDQILIVEASNVLSRFWARLSSLLSSDENTTYRLSMLSASKNLFYDLVDFQDAVLKKGLDNIEDVINEYIMIRSNVSALKLSLDRILETLNKNKIKENEEETNNELKSKENKKSKNLKTETLIPEEPKTQSTESNLSLEQLKRNAVSMQQFGFDVNKEIRPFLNIYNEWLKEKNESKKEIIEDRVRDIYSELYQQLIKFVSNKIDNPLPSNITLDELKNIFKTSSLDYDLIKNSGYPSRLFNKLKHWTNQDASTAPRMGIYAKIRQAKKTTDEIMDLLEEKNIDSGKLVKHISSLESIINDMSKELDILSFLYETKFDSKLNPAKRHFVRRIRQKVDKPGW